MVTGQGVRILGAFLLLIAIGCGEETGAGRPSGDGNNAGTGSGGAGAGDGDGSAGDGGNTSGDGDGPAGNGGGGGEPLGKADSFDAGSGENRNAVTPGTICERLSTIQCAGEAFCCAGRTRTQEQCKAAMLAGCTTELHLDDIAMDPIVGFDAAHGASAFELFEQKASTCDPSIATWGVSPEGLAGMQKGTLSVGDSCRPPSNQIGQEIPAGAALASCLNPQTHACRPKPPVALSWTCEERGGAGSPCFTDLNCSPGLFCDNPDFMPSGDECQARKANGQPCGAANHCQSLTCQGGTCVEATADTAFCLQ